MSAAMQAGAVMGAVVAALLAVVSIRSWKRSRRAAATATSGPSATPGRPSPVGAFNQDPPDDDDESAAGPGQEADDTGSLREPFGPDGEFGFFIREESGLQADGTYLHTQILCVADGLELPSVTLELIAPTLRHGEFRRGEIVVDSATAHGGVLTLNARAVSGHLVARYETTDPTDRVRAYWTRG